MRKNIPLTPPAVAGQASADAESPLRSDLQGGEPKRKARLSTGFHVNYASCCFTDVPPSLQHSYPLYTSFIIH